MIIAAQITGVLAVVLFLLSYQQKKRKNIIFFNICSRALYILQYLLLGAFSGAVLDILGILSSLLAQKKHLPFLKKHLLLFFLGNCALIIGAGALLYRDVFDLFPIAGILLHTGAFWLNNEKIIRRVSFLGSPFWLVYNLSEKAFGSALGDALTMVSLAVAMFRYDRKKQAKTK